MNYLLKRNEANDLLAVLYDIHLFTINQFIDRDRISSIPVLEESIGDVRTKIFFKVIGLCIRELISRQLLEERIMGGTEKLKIILDYHEVDSIICNHIKSALRHSHQAIHFNDLNPTDKNEQQVSFGKTEEHYRYTIRNAASLIYYTSGVKTTPKIRRIYEHNSSFYSITQIKKQIILPETQIKNSKNHTEIPVPRLPILFLLDTSNSMKNESRIEQLNQGVKWLNSALLNDTITKDSIVLSIITFDDYVKEILPFGRIQAQQQFLSSFKLEAFGSIKRIGGAIKLALKRMLEIKKEYQDNAVDYHQPWVIIITDCDNQNVDDYRLAAFELKDLEHRLKVNTIPIVVGNGEVSLFKQLTNKNKVIRMRGQSFTNFFEWIYENAVSLAKSEDDKPKYSDVTWGTIE